MARAIGTRTSVIPRLFPNGEMKDGPSSFPLRLPKSTRLQAIELAQNEGLSLNQFITLAVTEKIVRLERLDEATEEAVLPLGRGN